MTPFPAYGSLLVGAASLMIAVILGATVTNPTNGLLIVGGNMFACGLNVGIAVMVADRRGTWR